MRRALVEALHRDEARQIRAEELNEPSQLWGPAVQLVHSWLVHRDARDWLDGEQTIDALARTQADQYQAAT